MFALHVIETIIKVFATAGLAMVVLYAPVYFRGK